MSDQDKSLTDAIHDRLCLDGSHTWAGSYCKDCMKRPPDLAYIVSRYSEIRAENARLSDRVKEIGKERSHALASLEHAGEVYEKIEAERDALKLSLAESRDISERVAQLTAHRACSGNEHDGMGKLHGNCVVCIIPWPCEYAGTPPALTTPTPPQQEKA